MHDDGGIVENVSFHFQLVEIMFRRLTSFLVTNHLGEFDFTIRRDRVGFRDEWERRTDWHGVRCTAQTARLSEGMNEEIQRRPSRIETVDDQFGEMSDTFGIVRRRRETIVDESYGIMIQIEDIRCAKMRE